MCLKCPTKRVVTISNPNPNPPFSSLTLKFQQPSSHSPSLILSLVATTLLHLAVANPSPTLSIYLCRLLTASPLLHLAIDANPSPFPHCAAIPPPHHKHRSFLPASLTLPWLEKGGILVGFSRCVVFCFWRFLRGWNSGVVKGRSVVVLCWCKKTNEGFLCIWVMYLGFLYLGL